MSQTRAASLVRAPRGSVCSRSWLGWAAIALRPRGLSDLTKRGDHLLRCQRGQRAFTLVEFDLSGMDENAEICMASISMQQTDRGVNVSARPFTFLSRFRHVYELSKTGRSLSGRESCGLPGHIGVPGRRLFRRDCTKIDTFLPLCSLIFSARFCGIFPPLFPSPFLLLLG